MLKIGKSDAVFRPTQLLNCQWNASGIDDCQVLKYYSSLSYKALNHIYHFDHEVHENVYVLIFQHLTIVNASGIDSQIE